MRHLPPLLLACTLTTGFCLANTINVPGDQATIQDAINASVDGDLILVAPGLYIEFDIRFEGKGVTLRGSTGSDGLPTTTITSSGQGAIMSIGYQDIHPIVEDMVFTGTTTDTAVTTFHSNATFMNCTFLNNTGSLGGGFYNLNGAPSFIDCRFIGNTGNSGGGYACWETGQMKHPIFTRCLFDGNIGELGGGMANLRSQPTLTECIFINNQATLGAGIYNDGDSCCPQWEGNMILIDCLIEGNQASESGGGIYNATFGFPVIQGTTFMNNSAVVFGSAMASEDDMLPAVSGSIFCANQGTSEQISGPWIDDGGNVVSDDCSSECSADLDANGSVDVDDILTLLAAYEMNSNGDCDGDGDTDVDDLLLLISTWGPCP
jgi:predicted outer membrane repeat protein